MEIIDLKKTYKAPRASVIFVKPQGMLCQSPGNEPMGEEDISDAFTQN